MAIGDDDDDNDDDFDDDGSDDDDDDDNDDDDDGDNFKSPMPVLWLTMIGDFLMRTVKINLTCSPEDKRKKKLRCAGLRRFN